MVLVGSAEVCLDWAELLLSHTLPYFMRVCASRVYSTLRTLGVLGMVPSPQPTGVAKVIEGSLGS